MGVLQEGWLQELYEEGEEEGSIRRPVCAGVGQPEVGCSRDVFLTCLGGKFTHAIPPPWPEMTHARAQLVCTYCIQLYYVWCAGCGSSGNLIARALCCTASPVFGFLFLLLLEVSLRCECV